MAQKFGISHENIEIGFVTLINNGLTMRIVQFLPKSDLNQFKRTNSSGYNVSISSRKYVKDKYTEFADDVNQIFREHFDIGDDRFVVKFEDNKSSNHSVQQLLTTNIEEHRVMTKSNADNMLQKNQQNQQ